MVTWVFPSGRRYGRIPALRTSARRCGQPVGQPHRQRHEVLGLGAGVAEHHPLVAGALGVEGVLARHAGARSSRAVSTPWAMSGDCGSMVVITPQVLPSKPHVAVVEADAVDRLADDLGDLDVGGGADLTGHHGEAGGDHRLAGHPGQSGPRRGWRRGPRLEIWSAILSGWPSVTDSEVKVHWRLTGCSLCWRSVEDGAGDAPACR